ncbi:class I SAM-dependent methyltransferase [Thermohalobacter berrensis]|uniref:Methyltransferase domain-containing protein n=1 Tax=Thermohalobacter berrensis TaxID=99594 RepID=A0A419T8A9_9FIRM|nr:class I SAM-dependent methyltransferase [Thermohalobacter berrensis]RKD33790.1 hypothetical protein BET03_08690 [Thermohalobacter berrensis]
MDIDYFKKLWKKTDEDRDAVEKFWNSRADEFNKKISKRQEKDKDPIKFLIENNMLKRDYKVLDIGSGPGRYSIRFAKECKKVVAIDISEKMLEKAIDNAKKEKLDNIQFKKVFWEDLNLEENDWNKKFDLVFASMCPGINSYETLLKMVDASRNYCFLSGFAHRNDYLWNKLYKKLRGKDYPRFYDNKIYCIFNILWNIGYYPEIRYIDKNWEETYSIDYICNFYISRFELEGELSIEEKEQICKLLKEYSKDGYVKENVSSKVAWIYWSVK